MKQNAAAYLAAARAPAAAGPAEDSESLRVAYLDLLKLCLCDLAGTSTESVGRLDDGRVVSRRLSGDEVRIRSAGMDWPRQGVTMVGLERLDDLQRCVESVVADDVDGDLIEAGAWRGGASMLMRAVLDSLGAHDRVVYAADSFQGFPASGPGGPRAEARSETDELSAFDFLAVPLEDVKENFQRLGLERGVEFVPGFFADTMPGLRGRKWSVVRLDGDTYEATRLTLETLYPGLSPGGHLIVDDYWAVDDCRLAVEEFRRENGIEEPLREVDWTCVRWQRDR